MTTGKYTCLWRLYRCIIFFLNSDHDTPIKMTTVTLTEPIGFKGFLCHLLLSCSDLSDHDLRLVLTRSLYPNVSVMYSLGFVTRVFTPLNQRLANERPWKVPLGRIYISKNIGLSPFLSFLFPIKTVSVTKLSRVARFVKLEQQGTKTRVTR